MYNNMAHILWFSGVAVCAAAYVVLCCLAFVNLCRFLCFRIRLAFRETPGSLRDIKQSTSVMYVLGVLFLVLLFFTLATFGFLGLREIEYLLRRAVLGG